MISTTKTFQRTEIKPVWGGQKILQHYTVQTSGNGIRGNTYEAICELRGDELELVKISVEYSNEDTLVAEAVANLCGWQCCAYAETIARKAA